MGEVRERLKRHAWKACEPKGFQGSNPCLSDFCISLPRAFACALRDGGGESLYGMAGILDAAIAITASIKYVEYLTNVIIQGRLLVRLGESPSVLSRGFMP